MKSDRRAIKEKRSGSWKCHERGQVLVELAMCTVIFATFFVGIAEGSSVLIRMHQLEQVAREGARIASITKDVDTASSQAYIQNCMNQILANMGLTGANAPTISIATDRINNGDGTTTKLVDINVSQSISAILGGASFISALSSESVSAMISMPLLV